MRQGMGVDGTGDGGGWDRDGMRRGDGDGGMVFVPLTVGWKRWVVGGESETNVADNADNAGALIGWIPQLELAT